MLGLPLWAWILVLVPAIAGAAVVGNKRRQRKATRQLERQVRKKIKETAAEASARNRAQKNWKRAPLTGYAEGSTTLRRLTTGTIRCTPDCWDSRESKYDKHGRLTCECSCRGEWHGKGNPNSAAGIRRTPIPTPGTVRPPAALSTVPAGGGTVSVPTTTGTTVVAPAVVPPSRSRDVPVQSQGTAPLDVQRAMAAHAVARPRCAGGAVTVRTIRDRRTNPLTVTRQVKCDTCGESLL
jgi:hypothetical protein